MTRIRLTDIEREGCMRGSLALAASSLELFALYLRWVHDFTREGFVTLGLVEDFADRAIALYGLHERSR